MDKREKSVLPRLDSPSLLTAKIKVAKRSRLQEVDVRKSEGELILFLKSHGPKDSRLEMVLPLPQSESQDELRWIRCQCRVVRVEEKAGDRKLGLGAVIEEYELINAADLPRA